MAEPVPPAVVEALRFQRAAVELPSLASPLYAALLDAAVADIDAGGPCARVLAESPPGIDPIPDALSLRFLGGVHRLVLSGRAPALARWFPSAGGAFRHGVDDPSADFLATVEAHEDELVAALHQAVQTNEVGRCAALAVGFTALLRRHELPLRLLEVGASAGLNLRWDRWRYESGPTAWGEPEAPLRFAGDAYEVGAEPDVSAPAALGPAGAVVERRGCDRSPVDPTTEDGQLLLRSFVWPDQAERHARLGAALDAAVRVPATVDRADAGQWVAAQLAEPAPGATTVVFHSIVWQYLPDDTRSAIASAVESAGGAATAGAPVAWLRMEPSRDHPDLADLTLRAWPRGEEAVLARTGYHGRPIRNVGGLPPL